LGINTANIKLESFKENWHGHVWFQLAENFILVNGINARNAERSNAQDATKEQLLHQNDYVITAKS